MANYGHRGPNSQSFSFARVICHWPVVFASDMSSARIGWNFVLRTVLVSEVFSAFFFPVSVDTGAVIINVVVAWITHWARRMIRTE